MISEKQRTILDFAIKNNNKITKKQAIEILGNCYYCNAQKHVGDILSRMVKSQLLKRIKNGFFEIKTKKTVVNIINPSQLELL